ncbi:MAG: hypothetical protein FJ249_02505 [Nitrospira sp.]|nr:hypothetical protein [Nitrospira sp.]
MHQVADKLLVINHQDRFCSLGVETAGAIVNIRTARIREPSPRASAQCPPAVPAPSIAPSPGGASSLSASALGHSPIFAASPIRSFSPLLDVHALVPRDTNAMGVYLDEWGKTIGKQPTCQERRRTSMSLD